MSTRLQTDRDPLTTAQRRFTVDTLQRIEAMYANTRAPGAPLSDAELAAQLARQEAESLEIFNNDRELARLLQEVGDEPDVPGYVGRNLNATRQPARNAGALQRQPIRRATNNSQPTAAGNAWLSSMVNYMTSWFGAPSAEAAKTQPTPPTANIPRRPTGHVCVICQENIYGSEVVALCGHYYDISCTLDLFQAAMRDESLFPPRCCRQTIPFSSMEKHLTTAQVTLFREKTLEFGTKKRVYCASPNCSRFLCAQSTYSFWTGYLVRCIAPGCGTETCTKCKNRIEPGKTHTCEADQKERGVLSLGRQEGWARCPGCDQLIELNLGCYHMTCRCRTEFCYLCRATWKTCRCPQWDERRLVLTAEARVDAQLNARRANAGVGQAPARRVVVAPAPAPPPTRVYNPAPPVPQAPAVAAASGSGTNRTVGTGFHHFQPPNTNGTAATTTTRHIVPSSYASAASANVHTPSSSQRDSVASSSSNRSPFIINNTQKAVSVNERARLIREAVAELRVNHECEHRRWIYRSGGGRCQTCYHSLPRYLFRCGGCQMLACNRCRRNRL